MDRGAWWAMSMASQIVRHDLATEQQGLVPGLEWMLAEGRVVSGWMV